MKLKNQIKISKEIRNLLFFELSLSKNNCQYFIICGQNEGYIDFIEAVCHQNAHS
jgi:hypothetical protein